MNLTDVRQTVADAIGSIDSGLTVDIYTPAVANPPHAWVKVETIEPEVFGSHAAKVTGFVTVIVSDSTDDQADELLDAWLSDHTLVDAFDAAGVQVSRISQVGDEFQVGGQGYIGFVVEFESYA